MSIQRITAGAALAAAALLAPGAGAELYRCVGSDGQVTFTDNAATCGSGAVHEPKDVIQRAPSVPPSAAGRAPAAPRAAALREQAEAGHERAWRQKKLHKERELEMLERQREHTEEYAVWCNRGGELYLEDDAGLKRRVSCKSVHAELAAVERSIAEVRAYLDEGLEEECRRAGCLPGWIR